MIATVRMILAAVLSCAAGTAEAQSYRWVSAGAPPANIVVGFGGKQRPVCTFVEDESRGRTFLGGFHDGRCNASNSGPIVKGTKGLRFLLVVSGPAGGKWGHQNDATGYPPSNTAYGLAPVAEHYYICSVDGTPGAAPAYARGTSRVGGSGCPSDEQRTGSADQSALVN